MPLYLWVTVGRPPGMGTKGLGDHGALWYYGDNADTSLDTMYRTPPFPLTMAHIPTPGPAPVRVNIELGAAA